MSHWMRDGQKTNLHYEHDSDEKLTSHSMINELHTNFQIQGCHCIT